MIVLRAIDLTSRKAREDHTITKDSLADKRDHKTKSEEEEGKMKRLYELILKLNKHDNSEMMTAKQLGRKQYI